MLQASTDRDRFLTPSPIGAGSAGGAIFSFLLALGCSEGVPNGDGAAAYQGNTPLVGRGPLIEVLDSLLLEETEYYLGEPYSLSVDPADRSFLIADGYSGRIFRFGRNGGIVQWYGRPGEGPGEFRG